MENSSLFTPADPWTSCCRPSWVRRPPPHPPPHPRLPPAWPAAPSPVKQCRECAACCIRRFPGLPMEGWHTPLVETPAQTQQSAPPASSRAHFVGQLVRQQELLVVKLVQQQHLDALGALAQQRLAPQRARERGLGRRHGWDGLLVSVGTARGQAENDRRRATEWGKPSAP